MRSTPEAASFAESATATAPGYQPEQGAPLQVTVEDGAVASGTTLKGLLTAEETAAPFVYVTVWPEPGCAGDAPENEYVVCHGELETVPPPVQPEPKVGNVKWSIPEAPPFPVPVTVKPPLAPGR